MRNTKQKDLILKIINNSCTHPNANEVYEKAREELPNISLGTVYRNLADLLKSVEGKLDKANEIEKKVISVHKCTVAVIVLSVINMLGLAGIAAVMIFQMLF